MPTIKQIEYSPNAENLELAEVNYSNHSSLRNPIILTREIIFDIWHARELIAILFARDLKSQFRQSYLGYFWLLAPALMTTGLWLLLNRSKVLSIEDTGMPYPIFVLIGSIFWQSFSNGVMAPLNSFNSGKPVFMKLKVPPEAFILAGAARTIFDLLVSLLLIVPVLLFYETYPAPTAVLLPVAIFACFAMSYGIGILLIPLGSLYQDIPNAVGLGLRFAMFLAPVVFPAPKTGTLAEIMKVNPITPTIQTAREWLILGTTDAWVGLLIWLPVSLLAFMLGLITLRVVMPHLITRMGM